MPIMIFDTPVVVNVVVPESTGGGTSVLSNYPVNRTDFAVIKGVQNEPMFFVRDIDRKRVDPTGRTLTISIVDPEAELVLMQRDLVLVDAGKALYKLVILAAETTDWQPGPLRWSLVDTRVDGSQIMLYTDLNYGPYSSLLVREGPVVGPRQAQVLDPADFLADLMVAYSSALKGSASYGYPGGLQTFAATLAGFSGRITIQASLIEQPEQQTDWFDVNVDMIASPTDGVLAYNVPGSFLWLRIGLITVTGTVVQVLYKN